MNKKAKLRIINALIEVEPSISGDYRRINLLKKIILQASRIKPDKRTEQQILNMLLRHVESSRKLSTAITENKINAEQFSGLLCGNPNTK